MAATDIDLEGWDDFDHDPKCECCDKVTALVDIDQDIWDHDGVWVCEDCAPEYVDEAVGQSTWYAKAGSVVG